MSFPDLICELLLSASVPSTANVTTERAYLSLELLLSVFHLVASHSRILCLVNLLCGLGWTLGLHKQYQHRSEEPFYARYFRVVHLECAVSRNAKATFAIVGHAHSLHMPLPLVEDDNATAKCRAEVSNMNDKNSEDS